MARSQLLTSFLPPGSGSSWQQLLHFSASHSISTSYILYLISYIKHINILTHEHRLTKASIQSLLATSAPFLSLSQYAILYFYILYSSPYVLYLTFELTCIWNTQSLLLPRDQKSGLAHWPGYDTIHTNTSFFTKEKWSLEKKFMAGLYNR